ncbi:MAG: Gldg family protein [Treponemataceae bacterium]|nr:Gldg family protein [Treponemataceae bacterium]
MKKFSEWLKSPKSDFVLLIIVLLLLNIVGANTYFRLDLTSPRSYSLSKSSKQLVKTLEEPLSVKVFFSKNLPSPYNSVEQYLEDLLVEYKGSANRNFSYEFYNMDKEESQTLAQQYRIRQRQIQEVKDNEVGFKNVYMALALVYADSVEVLDVSDAAGLEYRLTSTISRMINTTSALAGLEKPVSLTLYYTKELADFGIKGFNNLEKELSQACRNVNKKNQDRIAYDVVEPDQKTIDMLVEKYGAEALTWKEKSGKEGRGVIAAVLEYGDNFRLLPIGLSRGFFGSYAIAGLENLEENLSDSLSSLVSRSEKIGYLTGFGIKSLDDVQNGSARLNMLVSDKYEFVELDLTSSDIPSSISNIVINGPVEKIPSSVFYKLDQFLMRGGNLTVFADTIQEIPPQDQYSFPTYNKIDTGLAEFLASYGIKLNQDYVLDQQCYKAFQQGYGEIPLYYVPIVERSGLNQKNPISKNLSYVLMVKNSSIELENTDPAVKSHVIAKTSPQAWTISDKIVLHPMYIQVPEDSEKKSYNIAVLLEGKFTSQYEKNPLEKSDKNEGALTGGYNHLSKAVQKGKIFLASSSELTTSTVIDENASQPIAIFVRNVIDYMSGNEDLCTMRTKGLSLNSLRKSSLISVRTAKIFNQYVVPLLIVACGLIVWRMRRIHRKKILAKYANSDHRETLGLENKKKKGEKNENK